MSIVNALKNLVLAGNLICLSEFFSGYFDAKFATITLIEFESTKKIAKNKMNY